jgi:hypothetical protein
MISHEVLSRSNGIKISRAISIDGDADRVAAQEQALMFAVGLGFSPSGAAIVATATLDLAGKLLVHSTRGDIVLSAMSHSLTPALTVTAWGQGKQTTDVLRATWDSSSTWARPSNSLAGVERLVGRFEIVSEVGKGTVVTAGTSHAGGSTAWPN